MSELHDLRSLVVELKQKYNLVNFVETGCHRGSALKEAIYLGFSEDCIYSCDVDSELVEIQQKNYPKAHISVGESVSFLTKLFQDHHDIDNVLFWLDAHFPEFGDKEDPKRWFPLPYELEVIVACGKKNFIIVMDDMGVLTKLAFRVPISLDNLKNILSNNYRIDAIIDTCLIKTGFAIPVGYPVISDDSIKRVYDDASGSRQMPSNYEKSNIKRLPLKGFNGSLVKFDNRLIAMYRISEFQLGYAFFNEDYNFIHAKHFVEIDNQKCLDPRLFVHDNELYMSASCCERCKSDQIALFKLQVNNDAISVQQETYFDKIQKWKNYHFSKEKNWIPFIHDDEIHYVYKVNPHIILKFSDGVELVARTDWDQLNWDSDWGNKNECRGSGNPVLLDDGNYLSTFHTDHYYQFFYMFSSNPTFQVLAVAETPFLEGYKIGASCFVMSMYREGDNVIICTGIRNAGVGVIAKPIKEIMAKMIIVK